MGNHQDPWQRFTRSLLFLAFLIVAVLFVTEMAILFRDLAVATFEYTYTYAY